MSLLSSRVGFALIVGIIAAGLAAARGFTAFEGGRVKLVRANTAGEAGGVTVLITPAEATRLRAITAVIAEVENTSSASASFVASIDGQRICEKTLAAHTSSRIDCVQTDFVPGAAHQWSMTSTAGTWSVHTAELATHHGRSNGFGDIVVLPIEARSTVSSSLLAALLIGLAAVVCFLLPAPALPRWVSALHVLIVALAVAQTLLLVFAPVVSRYFVIVSIKTIAAWLAVIAAPRVVMAGLAPLRRAAALLPFVKRALATDAAIGVLTLAAFGFVIAGLVSRFHGNYSPFVHISEYAYGRHPVLAAHPEMHETLMIENPGGYDGQFMYFAALDPFMRHVAAEPVVYLSAFDDIVYRCGRIGFAWMIALFSAGDWQRFPTVMTWLVLAGLGVGALLLARLARVNGRHPAWGLLIVIIPAFWQSVLYALPEPIAAALVLAGYLAVRRGYVWWGAAAFAFALLTRETTSIFIAALLVWLWMKRREYPRWMVLLCAFVPLALWRLYIAQMLYPTLGTRAFFSTSPVLGVPFGGILEMWSRLSAGTYFPDAPLVAASGVVFPFVIAFAAIVSVLLAIFRPSPITIAGAVYALISVSFNYVMVWSHVGNAQRTSYEMFVMLALATAERGAVPLWLERAVYVFWIATGAFVFFGAYDGNYARETLPLFVTVFLGAWLAKLVSQRRISA